MRHTTLFELCYRFKQHMDVQKIVFRRQIQLALEMKKPLVIHCRDAEDDCLQILQEVRHINTLSTYKLQEVRT